MSRPLRIPIDDGINDWDALINDNLVIAFDAPIPIHASASLTESNLAATFPAAQYDRCVVWVNHTVVGYLLYWSDGTDWIPSTQGRMPTRVATGTVTQLAADVRVRFTGAGTFDYDLLAAASWAGRTVIVRNDTSGTVDLDPNGAETINGGATKTLAAGETARIFSNGTALFADVSL